VRKEEPWWKIVFPRTILKRYWIVNIMDNVATGKPGYPPTIATGRQDGVFAETQCGEITTDT
jgi:hypothetical protein